MSRAIEKKRRGDAHQKIRLGGLVVKAGLRECNASILLGAMIEVADALDNADTAKVSRWRELGSSAFGADTKKRMGRDKEDA